MAQFPSLSLIDNISLVSVWEFNVINRRWRLVSITRPSQAIAMSKGTGRLVFPTSINYHKLSRTCPAIDLLDLKELPVGNKDKILVFVKKNPGQSSDLIAEYLKIELRIVLRCLGFLERRGLVYCCRSIKSSKKLYYAGSAPKKQASSTAKKAKQNRLMYP